MIAHIVVWMIIQVLAMLISVGLDYCYKSKGKKIVCLQRTSCIFIKSKTNKERNKISQVALVYQIVNYAISFLFFACILFGYLIGEIKPFMKFLWAIILIIYFCILFVWGVCVAVSVKHVKKSYNEMVKDFKYQFSYRLSKNIKNKK